MNVTLPTIHLNGTSPQTLLDDNLAVREALQNVLDVMSKQEFNARDYYPVEGSWEKACEERRALACTLRDYSDYFLTIAEHCSNVILDRLSRRSK